MKEREVPFVFAAATMDEVPELARLDALCFHQHSYPPALFARFISLDLPCIVARDAASGELAGFAMAMTEPEEGTGLLVTLDVVPEQRRRGLGTALVVRCARALLERGPHPLALWLTVASRNHAARAFYDSLRFREVDRMEGYYGDDDAIVMLHLDPEELAGLEEDPTAGGSPP